MVAQTAGDGAPPAVAGDLIQRARERLAHEMALLPSWQTPAFWARLYVAPPAAPVSFGALVRCIRLAHAASDIDATRELFTALLRRIDGLNRRWASRTVRHIAGLDGWAGQSAREDLLQELTLYLWERIARQQDDAWELFFQRALDFAQRHVAMTYLRTNGYVRQTSVRQPARGVALLLSTLHGAGQPGEHGDLAPCEPNMIGMEGLHERADFADLRALVLALPERERIAVVLRFWQRASEAEIAAALGGVTSRTVRNLLRRAYTRLAWQYTGGEAPR